MNVQTFKSSTVELLRIILNQGCGVGRFFRIPTPDSDSSSFEKPTPDSDSSSFKKPTPTPAFLKTRFLLQLKTCDSTDSTTLAVTAVVAASYL